MTAPDQLDATFAALADPTRRAILARLAESEASVLELAEPFAMSPAGDFQALESTGAGGADFTRARCAKAPATAGSSGAARGNTMAGELSAVLGSAVWTSGYAAEGFARGQEKSEAHESGKQVPFDRLRASARKQVPHRAFSPVRNDNLNYERFNYGRFNYERLKGDSHEK